MDGASYSAVAGGNIAPAVFVTMSESSGEPVVTVAGANALVWGISPKSSRRMALSGWDDGYAAIAGDNVACFGPGDDEALLTLGGTVTSGQPLKSDGSGFGVTALTDKDRVGAIALEAGSSGDFIKVKPVRYDVSI
jgi:hypothetical protein